MVVLAPFVFFFMSFSSLLWLWIDCVTGKDKQLYAFKTYWNAVI
jgi:hypothetical protein